MYFTIKYLAPEHMVPVIAWIDGASPCPFVPCIVCGIEHATVIPGVPLRWPCRTDCVLRRSRLFFQLPYQYAGIAGELTTSSSQDG